MFHEIQPCLLAVIIVFVFTSKFFVIFEILMATKEVHFWATFPISQLHLDALMSVWTTYSPCMAGDHVMLWTGNIDDRRWQQRAPAMRPVLLQGRLLLLTQMSKLIRVYVCVRVFVRERESMHFYSLSSIVLPPQHCWPAAQLLQLWECSTLQQIKRLHVLLWTCKQYKGDKNTVQRSVLDEEKLPTR